MTRSATNDAAASASTSPTGYKLPRAARLRRVGDIRRTMRKGRRHAGPFVDVFSVPSSAGRARVAIIVPRYGRTAVARNKVRRRLMNIARTSWMPTLIGQRLDVDFIFRAKPAAYEASYIGLQDSLVKPLEAACAR